LTGKVPGFWFLVPGFEAPQTGNWQQGTNKLSLQIYMSESLIQSKLANLIRKEISAALGMGQNYVPGGMLTVSVVRITGDLSIAKIYITTLPEAHLEEAVERLNANSWEIRKNLAARIRNKVRKIPELRFHVDDSFEEAARIEKLLDAVKKEDEEEN
jgi:ribosome-binding factor A